MNPFFNYRLIPTYLTYVSELWQKKHTCWDFDVSNAWTQRVSALDEHQNWSTSASFCYNFRVRSKYIFINLIHIQHKETFHKSIHWVQNVIKYHQRNTITGVAYELTLHTCESTLCDAHACICTARGVRSAIVQK